MCSCCILFPLALYNVEHDFDMQMSIFPTFHASLDQNKVTFTYNENHTHLSIYWFFYLIVKSKHKFENFLNISIIEITELQIAILNMGPKHLFRDNFHPSDIVKIHNENRRRCWLRVTRNGADYELPKNQLKSVKLENIKNWYNRWL